jgi:uncharacterized membrane protein
MSRRIRYGCAALAILAHSALMTTLIVTKAVDPRWVLVQVTATVAALCVIVLAVRDA